MSEDLLQELVKSENEVSRLRNVVASRDIELGYARKVIRVLYSIYMKEE